MKKYYYLGSLRIALRTGAGGSTTGLQWLISDHLGSTSTTYRADTGATTSQRYMPWGEPRCASAAPDGTLPTQYTYTGEYS